MSFKEKKGEEGKKEKKKKGLLRRKLIVSVGAFEVIDKKQQKITLIRFINLSSLYGYRIDKSKHCLNRAKTPVM